MGIVKRWMPRKWCALLIFFLRSIAAGVLYHSPLFLNGTQWFVMIGNNENVRLSLYTTPRTYHLSCHKRPDRQLFRLLSDNRFRLLKREPFGFYATLHCTVITGHTRLYSNGKAGDCKKGGGVYNSRPWNSSHEIDRFFWWDSQCCTPVVIKVDCAALPEVR